MVVGLLRPKILSRIVAGIGAFFLMLKLMFPKAGFFGYYGMLFLILGVAGIIFTTGMVSKIGKK